MGREAGGRVSGEGGGREGKWGGRRAGGRVSGREASGEGPVEREAGWRVSGR